MPFLFYIEMKERGDNVNVLVVGGGGREHTIAKKLVESPKVETVYCAPGNPGMKRDAIEVVEIAEDAHQELIGFAKKKEIKWTIIGPEIPLFNGIVDDFKAEGLSVFGPTKAATQIEASKEFAKELMMKQNIPTAAYDSFTDYEQAQAYIEQQGAPIVIKADGLAAGKGVVVAETLEEAKAALKEMMLENKFGESSAKVVIEECLVGEEFSLFGLVKGDKVYPTVISQDHKRAFDGDKGPNTGGMGAYAPVPHLSDSIVQEAIDKVLIPAAEGMKKEGTPFTGVLYAGLMATENGVKTIEFNARFGDPETQVVLNRLDSDFAQVITDILEDREPSLEWKKEGVDLGVVVAAEGYPGSYQKEIPLELPNSEETQIYFAGVKEKEERLVSNGGRIYLVEVQGETIEEAQQKAYTALNEVDTSGTFYREDIGDKAK